MASHSKTSNTFTKNVALLSQEKLAANLAAKATIQSEPPRTERQLKRLFKHTENHHERYWTKKTTSVHRNE